MKKTVSSQKFMYHVVCRYVCLLAEATNSQAHKRLFHFFILLLMRLNASHLSRIERIARQIKI